MSLRLYRFLIMLYPPEFRQEFGREMVGVFADQLDEAAAEPDGPGLWSVWICALREAVTLALPMHLRSAVVMASFVSLVGTSVVYVALFRARTDTPHLHHPVQHALVIHLR